MRTFYLWSFLALSTLSVLAQENQPIPLPAGVGESHSLQAQQLWPAGNLGLTLTGAGETIYQWEAAETNGSFPDTSNIQLVGRTTTGNTYTGNSGHATQMAQIMIGQTGDSTQGIAYNASIKAYSLANFWLNMRAASVAGMRISSHAYGFDAGANASGIFWNGLQEIDSTEDYNFGRYGVWDARFDSLLFAAPYYLAIQSAGNGRGVQTNAQHQLYQSIAGSTSNYEVVSSNHPRQANGGVLGFDCLAQGATYKNGLLIGAAQILPQGWQDSSSVNVQAGSAFGPTDDGRIKPDLVAGGAKTSQATAAIAGLLALLREQYISKYGKQPLANTLKTLLIHTADAAGNTNGPDYKHGWGLVNASSAAKHLLNINFLHPHYEDTLISGDTNTYYFYVDSIGLKVTLGYTDPAGTPVPFALNPSILNNTTAMLTNDIDIRLTNISTGTVHFPYVLSGSNPSAAATKADNMVDNVEQIEAQNIAIGWYKLLVINKGTLVNGAQPYSLMISGARKALFTDQNIWKPFSPSGSTGTYDAYIAPNSIITLPAGFSIQRMHIGSGAQVVVQ